MKIVSMSNVDWEKSPNIKAIATIETGDGVQIKECKVIMGEFGVFVASPSKKSNKPWTKTMKDGSTKTMNYDDLVYFPKEIQAVMSDIVTDCYDPTKPLHKAYTSTGEMVTYSKPATATTTEKTTAKAPEFSDEDIPF